MNRKTYEILAKWIAKTNGVTIEFKPDACPCVDMKTKHIILPSNISEEHAFASLAQLMHEAGHVRYTGKIPLERVTKNNKIAQGILNAIEDIRIDRKNFYKLPNIKEFYKRGVDYELEHRKKVDMTKVPLHKKVLINAIYDLEGLSKGRIRDQEADDFTDKHEIRRRVDDAINAIEYNNWDNVERMLDELMKIFGLDKIPKVPLNQEGESVQPCSACNGTGKDAQGDTCGTCDGKGTLGITDLSDLKPSGVKPGKGTTVGNSELGEVVMQEITKQRFKDMLNIKEIKRIPTGNMLDTDNLHEILTGNIDELFHEEHTIRKKKSRIKLLLDASGSMEDRLLDGKTKKNVVGGCAKSLVQILRELEYLEGLNVDWSIAGFTGDYHPFDKESWESKYKYVSGGTNLEYPFAKVHDEMLMDQEIDGKRIIIVFTDGDVGVNDVELVKERIIKHGGSDVRVMIIGVGASVTGSFVRDICGDNNILAEESSDQILLDAIMTCLD